LLAHTPSPRTAASARGAAERLEELLARLPAGGMEAPAFDLSSDEDDPDDDVQVMDGKVGAGREPFQDTTSRQR